MFEPQEKRSARRPREDAPSVPPALATAAGWSWRLLVIVAAVAAVVYALSQLRPVVIALFLALFATAILRPPTEALKQRGWPPVLAAVSTLATAIAVLGGLIALLAPSVVHQLEELATSLQEGVNEAGNWLLEGPLNLSESQLEDSVDRVVQELGNRSGEIASGAISGALLVVEVAAAVLVAVVLTFFFLKDGDRLWGWFVELLSPARQDDAREIGSRAWATFAGFLRGMTVVALFDATFIGIALVVLDVPAALPLAVLTFVGAYIPIVGALVTGMAAVLVALVGNGLGTAIAVAVAVIIVQQVESNVLHPVVVGKSVSLHPVVILLAVTSGALVAGVLGALIAVPIAAVAARVGGYLRETNALSAPDGPRVALPADGDGADERAL